MSDFHHRAVIEFFGGPCDGLQRPLACPIHKLAPTTFIPLPFLADSRWRPAWIFRPRRQAIYALDREPGQCGYRYLGTIRRGSCNRGGKLRALARWLRGAFERRPDACRATSSVRHNLFDRNV
jgi:hypothetical protein